MNFHRSTDIDPRNSYSYWHNNPMTCRVYIYGYRDMYGTYIHYLDITEDITLRTKKLIP